jgi:hypothetical protein
MGYGGVLTGVQGRGVWVVVGVCGWWNTLAYLAVPFSAADNKVALSHPKKVQMYRVV